MNKSYEFLRWALLTLLRRCARRPVLVFSSLLMLIIVCSFGLRQIKTLLALEDLVDSSFASKMALDDLEREFEIHNPLVLVVKKPASDWSPEVLCAINQWLTSERIENPDILSTHSALDVREARVAPNTLSYPRLIRLGCLGDTENLAASDLKGQLAHLLSSPWGFSTLGGHAREWIVQIDLREAGPYSRTGTFDPNRVEGIHRSFEKLLKQKGLSLEYAWVGTADFQYHLYLGLKRVNLLNLILLVVLTVLIRWIFGTWRAGVLFGGSVLASGVICYGLMGWSHIPIDILSKSLLLMIAVAAIEDFVYLVSKTYSLDGNWKRAWRTVMIPGFLTSLTTVIGFLSLCTSSLQVIRRFGFWAAVGSIAEWMVIFLLLPAIFQIFPFWSRFVRPSPKLGFGAFHRLKVLRVPKRIASVALLAFFVLPYAFQNLNVKDVPNEMFSADHPFRRGLAELKAESGWEAQASLIFDRDVSAESAAGVVDEVRKMPGVVQIVGAADFERFFSSGVEKPEIKKLILSELNSVSFMSEWIGKSGERRYNLYLAQGDTSSIFDLEQGVQAICRKSKCRLAGIPIVYAEFSRKVPMTLLESFSLSILMVGLVLSWLTWARGQLRNLHWILLSSFWGTSLMFLFISIFAVKVNFLTCIFASVLVGLTGDNAIQFLMASKRQSFARGISDAGGAALIAGFLMAVSSLVFLGSYFVPPRVFGALLMGGFIASTIGDYWILKTLIGHPRESDQDPSVLAKDGHGLGIRR